MQIFTNGGTNNILKTYSMKRYEYLEIGDKIKILSWPSSNTADGFAGYVGEIESISFGNSSKISIKFHNCVLVGSDLNTLQFEWVDKGEPIIPMLDYDLQKILSIVVLYIGIGYVAYLMTNMNYQIFDPFKVLVWSVIASITWTTLCLRIFGKICDTETKTFAYNLKRKITV